MTTIHNINSPSNENQTKSFNKLPIRNRTVHYHLDFKHFNQHLVDVTVTFIANQDAPILWLPAWIPGSYLMREFARNITAVHYQQQNVQTPTTLDSSHSNSNQSTEGLRALKMSKHEWQLTDIKADEEVRVNYEVYCYDLSVRTAYVDQTRLYGNFTSLALAIEGLEKAQVSVTLAVPQDFYDLNVYRDINGENDKKDKRSRESSKPVKIACGLKHTHLHNDREHYYHLEANNYAELIDYPFEIAPQDEFDFIIHDTHKNALPHRFYIAGKHTANIGRLQQDINQICQTYLNWLGDAPFNDYIFMTYASGNDYGGLEHINSTSLVTPRSDLPTQHEKDEPSEAYQRFLGLCSHEYFHSWWVKTVRPDVMMDVNLRKEAYTPLLWVFEGFTSYIDDFMLQASGVVNKDSYLKLLGAQINRYTQTHGRHLQSVAESSFDAWIKLYRADENTGNAGISYYNKGALVALCLDLTLMVESAGKYRLFDVVKAFYAKANAENNKRIGMTNANLEAVISQFIDKEKWQDFKAKYVDGVEELPIKQLLEANGVSLGIEDKDNTLPWGIAVSETSEGLKVNKVLRDSVASEAGISAKDVLVAIDGVKATKKQLQSVAKSASEPAFTSVQCHAFRRDELMIFNVINKTQSGISANPSLEKTSLNFKESGFETWLQPNCIK